MSNGDEMRLADYVTSHLAGIGVKNVFMLSGTGSIHLDDAFAHQKGMRYICARHEAAAVLMATATAKLNNEVGVIIATTGPGGTNAIGGVVEAWVDSAPVLVISGQVHTKQVSKNVRSFGVQGFNIIENVKKITKYSAQITNPNLIKYHLEKSIFMAKNERPGPVWIDIPMNIQAKKINLKNLKSFNPPKLSSKKKNLVPKFFMNLLKSAKKPVIIFGQGIRSSDSIELFKDLLSLSNIPAISARMGIDILPHNYTQYIGLGGMRGQLAPYEVLKEADFVIALGTSLTHAFAGKNYNQFSKNAKLAMVNCDVNELDKPGLNLDISFKAELKSFIGNLIEKINEEKEIGMRFSKWLKVCNEYKKKIKFIDKNFEKNPINSYFFVKKLSENCGKNTIFVSDAGSANYVCSQALKIKEGQRELTSGAFYSMGLSVPLAIGASVSYPKKKIIAITGDGSVELNIQELKTISINKLEVKLFVINNGGYASIRKSQDDMVGGRYTDDIEILNFKKIADAFELPYHIVDNYQNLDSEIKYILSKKGPMLIELVCDPNQKILEIFGD